MGRRLGTMAMVLLGGCLAEPEQLAVPVWLVPSEAALTLDDGREIRVTEATLTLGDLLLEGPSPAIAWWPTWTAVAHAHPGHGGLGEVRGELRGAWTVDLLASEVQLGEATLFEGAFATGRLHLMPDTPVTLQGEVETARGTTPFSFTFDVHEEVAGIGFDEQLDAARPPDAVLVEVDLAEALSHVDWDEVTAEGGGDAEGNLASLRFGLLSTNSWNLELE